MGVLIAYVPRIDDFVKKTRKRWFTFGDIDCYLMDHEQKPLSTQEKAVIAALVKKNVLVRTYRQREKKCESLFKVA